MEIGNVKVQQTNRRGWLVGQFLDEKSDFNDKDVEICIKEFPKGAANDHLHTHPYGREYLIILSGKVKMRIGEEVVILSENDYVAIPNNVPDQFLEIVEDLVMISVRCPSVPNNKILL